jgi:hypothetical protein
LTLVQPATTTNRWNDATPDYGAAATRRTIRGYIEQPSSTEPITDDRAPLIGAGKLLTNDLAVSGVDRIEDGPATYEITGPPWPVDQPGHGPHHLEAQLQKVEG